MTTNYFNKFKNTKINDTNNLGYALTTSGNIICNGTSNINGNMNVTGLGTFIGNSNVLPITITGGGSGLSIYWNVFTGGTGETSFLNYGQSGPGGFCFYTGNVNTIPKCIAYLDTNSNLSKLNNVSCASITSTGGITNSNAAITNNSTLSQVGAATFNSLSATSINNSGTLNVSDTSNLTGILYTYGGITNINYAIVNNSTLTQVGTSVFADVVRVSPGKSLYISDNTFTNYLRMHHTGIGGNSVIDFTGNMLVRNSGTTTPISIDGGTNQVTLISNLNTNGIINSSTNAITNNGILYQNNASTFSTNITAPSISTTGLFYAGSSNTFDTTAISSPKVINGIASGTEDGASYTQFNLGINSWQGVGFVYSNSGGPSVCKLVIDNRTGNLSTQGTITCNTINAATYNVGSTSYTGPIYMSNASPIYLKSSTDLNHYIKYDSVYDGPQLGFFTGLSIKCTDNNAIILNTSKTNININVDTNVNSNCVISNQCTVQNGLVSEKFNQSNYYTFKGSTWNVTFSTSYSYTNFDGSHGSSLSESLQIPSNCKTVKITYSYNTTYPNNVFQGASEYVIYGAYYSGIATVWQVGSTNYTPIITCSSTGLLYIEFPKNRNLTGHCYWSFGILMI